MVQHQPRDHEVSDAINEQLEESVVLRANDIIKPLEEPEQEFDFWEDLKDSLPPWIDEVVGFALFVFGILSFISLYFPAEAMVAVAWAEILSALFGEGGVFVAGTLFALGVLLWLPKAGIRVRLGAVQLLAIEIAFLAALAALHLSNSDVELRALARAGQGGGLIGWGLSFPFYWVMGREPALVFFLIVIVAAVIIIIGIRRRHIVGALGRISQNLQDYGTQTRPRGGIPTVDDPLALYRRFAESTAYRTQIMRIRPDPEHIPQEIRARRQGAQKTKNKPIQVPANGGSVEVLAEGPVMVGETEQNVQPGVDKPADVPPALAGDLKPKQQSSEETHADEAQALPDVIEQPRANGALPNLDLLTATDMRIPDEQEINHNVALIENTLLEFDIEINVVDVQVGPTVTRYALQPHKGDGSERIRLSKIASYSRDLSLALAAKRLRMETPVPGTNFMGIEVPNKSPGTVALRNVMESEHYTESRKRSDAPLLIPLGRDVAGKPVSLDLAQMPHLLIAGTTGSGKSVCMAAIATALLMQNAPDRLKLVMLDPKRVELTRFNGIPHLLGPVETQHERITGILRWCTREMDRRYKVLEKRSVRHIDAYNERQANSDSGTALPYLVILIDEIGDLMLSDPIATEAAITRLAQMARAVGMHMVVATQRPSVDVITGLIKANFPSRIAFSVASGADSRVILDKTGAENLLGKGDMLFLSADASGPQRVQGCYVSEEEVRAVVQHWRQWRQKQIDSGVSQRNRPGPWERGLERGQFLTDTDPMLEEVLQLVVEAGAASASLIQRRLGLGYPRAARIMDLLEELGVVGEVGAGGRSRKVIIPAGTDPFKFVLERHQKNKPQD